MTQATGEMLSTSYWTVMDSPIGSLHVGGDVDRVSCLSMEDHCHRPVGRLGAIRDDARLSWVVCQLHEYFAGERRTVEFDRGTPFPRAVWRELSLLPFGETVSYGQLGAGTTMRYIHHRDRGDIRAVSDSEQPIHRRSRRPNLRLRQPGIDEVPVAADECVDLLLASQSHQVVVLSVARRGRLVDRVIHDRGMTADALDELPRGAAVDVLRELRSPQHPLELIEQEWAGNDLDPVVCERAHHEIRGTPTAADECGDEDAGVDYDPDHAAPRSRRAACSSV